MSKQLKLFDQDNQAFKEPKSNNNNASNNHSNNHNIRKIPEEQGFNSSFMTKANMEWFLFVVNWLPDSKKPLVFLPCGSAAKTREKHGKKMISKGLGHNFLSAITSDNQFERVILSEPLTIIPYELEDHPLRPDYNIPPHELSIQSERIFINQLSLWLLKVKAFQPDRKYIYYVGATHHYFILTFANKIAGEPFKLIHSVPEKGLVEYSKAAKELKTMIINLETKAIEPELRHIPLEKLINSRGRYTNRKFWKEVIILKNTNKRAMEFESSKLKITTKNDFKEGFAGLYATDKPITVKEVKK